MNPAPIVLFTYKRFDTLKRTVNALRNNYLAPQSDLYIFSDGPKRPEDEQLVGEIRNYIKGISGFNNVVIHESPINKGLANSIIQGVSMVVRQHGTAIVLEDDLLTTPNFLDYMNQTLARYEGNKQVLSISGYSFNLGEKINNEDTYFLNRGWSWGWATWQDRWAAVDWTVADYHTFKKDARARKSFAEGGSDLNKMLDKQMEGKLDSWAIRWFFHQFMKKGLTVYPVHSKIYNDGFDGDATHTTGANNRYLPNLDREYMRTFCYPSKVGLDGYFQARFQSKMGIGSRIRSKFETFFKKVLAK